MENSMSNFKKAVLEYEKSGTPKLINNKYKIVSVDDPNEYIFVDKDELPNISNNFITHVFVKETLPVEDGLEDKCDPQEIILKPELSESETFDKRTIWTDEATKLLLSLYKQTEPLLGSREVRNKRKMWESISSEMCQAGFIYTSEQIENRFKTLIRAYRKVNQTDTIFSKHQRPCIYQEELDNILLKDPVKLPDDTFEIHYEQGDSNQDMELEDDTEDLFDVVSDLDTKKIDWDEKASKLLLSLYKKKKPLVEKRKFKHKKEMWESIAAEINKRNYIFTGGQVENRFKTLLRGYKKVLKEGTKKKLFIYQDELDEIFLEDDDVFPEIISGSERRSLKKQISERLGMELDEDDNNEPSQSTTSNVPDDENSSVLSVLKEIRNELVNSEKRAADRHSELVKLLKEANDIQRRKTDLIERYATVRKT